VVVYAAPPPDWTAPRNFLEGSSSPRLARAARAAALTRAAQARLLGCILALFAQPTPEDAVPALVRRSLGGDRGATRDLVRRVLCPLLEARIGRRLARRGASRQELADQVQQVLLRLFEDDAAVLRRWDPARGTLAAYVGTIADNAVISALRRPAQPAPTEAPDDARSPDSGPESKAAFRSLMSALLEELGEDDFMLFRLAFVEGLSPEEVGDLLGMRRDAVYKRLQRLRPRLRQLCDRLVSNPAPAERNPGGEVRT
jgi:RNA polymerase sigma factor (sigma-70 family)